MRSPRGDRFCFACTTAMFNLLLFIFIFCRYGASKRCYHPLKMGFVILVILACVVTLTSSKHNFAGKYLESVKTIISSSIDVKPHTVDHVTVTGSVPSTDHSTGKINLNSAKISSCMRTNNCGGATAGSGKGVLGSKTSSSMAKTIKSTRGGGTTSSGNSPEEEFNSTVSASLRLKQQSMRQHSSSSHIPMIKKATISLDFHPARHTMREARITGIYPDLTKIETSPPIPFHPLIEFVYPPSLVLHTNDEVIDTIPAIYLSLLSLLPLSLLLVVLGRERRR